MVNPTLRQSVYIVLDKYRYITCIRSFLDVSYFRQMHYTCHIHWPCSLYLSPFAMGGILGICCHVSYTRHLQPVLHLRDFCRVRRVFYIRYTCSGRCFAAFVMFSTSASFDNRQLLFARLLESFCAILKPPGDLLGVLLGPLGASWEPLGSLLGASWSPLGSLLEPLGAPSGVLESPGEDLGALERPS